MQERQASKTLNLDNYFLNTDQLHGLHLRQSSNKFLELVHEMISTWSHTRRSTSETATSTSTIAIIAAAARFKIQMPEIANFEFKKL